MLGSINWLSVFVATLSSFVVGALWYGPLFQKPWMAATGMTKEKGAKGNMALIFGGTFVLNLFVAAGIAVLLGSTRSLLLGLHTGLFTAFFFVATALGVIYLFEQRSLKLWLINAGYQVVIFTVMGGIIGAWPK
ncbi:MAG: DUF1761 domain-containing protein [Steroidobacteraceae bacterium]